ncbi:UNVERIFIED_CONTAM: 2-dehydropantoate 2-reductase, partial [Pseudomonas aeruginosa]
NDVLLIDGWQEHINAIKENGLKANYNGEEITVKVSIVNQNEVPTGEQFD